MPSGFLLRRWLFTLLLGLFVVPNAGAQEWIRHLKAYPPAFQGRELVIEGTVAGARPAADQGGGPGGSYYLVDQSDLAGILVRTSRMLPAQGSTLEVTGTLRNGEVAEGGLPVFIETARSLKGLHPAVRLGAGVFVLATLVLGVLLIGAWRGQRQHELGAPLWLIPTGSNPGDAPLAAPGALPYGTPEFDLALEASDRARGLMLRRRTRRLLVATGVAVVASVSSAGWVAVSRAEPGSRTFVWEPTAIDASAVPIGALDPPTGDSTAAIDLGGPLEPPPPPAMNQTPTSSSPPVTRVTTPPPQQRAVEPNPVPNQTRPAVRPTRDTAPVADPVRVVDTASTPVVVPPPAAPPPSPVVVRVPPPPPPPPPPDTAAIREAAESIVAGEAAKLVEAINRGDRQLLASLLGSDGPTPRFLDFIKDNKPSTALRSIPTPTILGDQAETVLTIGLRWRGDFGGDQRRDASFRAILRRSGTRWVPEGFRLTARFP